MNILWITNSLLPEALEQLGGSKELKGSGSWILALAEGIIKNHDIKLTIATVSNKDGEVKRIQGKYITYYLLPGGKKGFFKINHSLEPLWRFVKDEVKPDIVHIHGTEYTHGLAWLEACGADNVCISIQGLVSIIGKYYTYGLNSNDIRRAKLHYAFFHRGILAGLQSFCERGKSEREMIRRVHHVIGRTDWDCCHIWAINPNAIYHKGGEILRKEFYGEDKWEYKKCLPHSVFISQASYPIKGFSVLLQAMHLVRRQYPDAIIRVAGENPMVLGNLKKWIQKGDYNHIIKSLIKKYQLQDCIYYTGPLNAEEIKTEYLRCNVFVCPSSIENSPNSLCEAQALGVPVLASYAGGIPTLMKGDEAHLYRFEETEMLAKKICEIFEAESELQYLESERNRALMRHNPKTIVEDLLDIYKVILKN